MLKKGGVIYINKDAKDITAAQVANIVATHEVAHYLKDSNPVIFNALKDELNRFVKVEINEEGKFTGVTFTDRTIENLINKAEPNFISLLTKQLNEYAENALKEKIIERRICGSCKGRSCDLFTRTFIPRLTSTTSGGVARFKY